MADQSTTTTGHLLGAPPYLRGRLVSAMRWTLWLSVVSVPFAYGTTVLLARVGPEVIGTYALLTVYAGLASVFFFLGGNLVAIKFIPEVGAERRVSFLVSYFLVICVAALPYQVAASLWPGKLQYLLGKEASAPFEVLLVWLVPVPILFSLALATLKGMLEIKWAQVLARILTLGSFGTYAVLYLAARPFLANHYTEVIWGFYFALAILITAIATRRILVLTHQQSFNSPTRFFLPDGFWRFTLGLQASSVLGFLSTRLDFIFILNAGGLAVLGRYFALMTLVAAIPMAATFVLDSFVPSLTNTLALKDFKSSRQLTEVYLRFMLPCGLAAACGTMLFAHPLIRLLGPRYSGLVDLFLLAVPFAAIQSLNWFTGTTLSAIGQPHADGIAKAIRIVVYCTSFWVLWPRFQLIGAVSAWALAQLSYQCMSLYVLLRKRPFYFSLFPTYGPFLVVISLAALSAKWIGGNRPILSLVACLALMLAFLFLSRYTLDEIRKLMRIVLPARELRH